MQPSVAESSKELSGIHYTSAAREKSKISIAESKKNVEHSGELLEQATSSYPKQNRRTRENCIQNALLISMTRQKQTQHSIRTILSFCK
jgi:hypothetical protein